MGRTGWTAWSVDAAAVCAAVGVLVLAGDRPFGTGPGSPGAPLSLVLVWAATASAAVVVAFAAGGRRPLRPAWAGPVALTLAIPGVATVDTHAGVRVVAVALAAGLALAVAAFALAVGGVLSRLAVAALAVATVFAVAARTVVRDPIRELRCAPYCRDNPLLIVAREDWVAAADRVLAVTTLIWCTTTCVQLARSKVSNLSRVSAALAVTAAASNALVAVASPGSTTWSEPHRWAPALTAGLFIPAFVLATRTDVQIWWTRRHMRALTATLADSVRSGGVAGHLRRLAGDPSIRLLFPEPSDSRMQPQAGIYVDERGQPAERDVRRSSTTVERNGAAIAVVEHDPASSDILAGALTPAVAVAIENEQLGTLARTELAELRTSRRRVVERADATRRRLERDLHDGAQQRLLLLGMELSRAAAAAADDSERERYVAAAAQTSRALAELRRLVHERASPVLDELGLVEALRSLAETSSIPVIIEPTVATDYRPPIAVERAVYSLAVTVVRDGEASGATRASVELAAQPSAFTATVRHNAPAPILDLTDDDDRVGAVGGTLNFHCDATGLHATAQFPKDGAP